MYNATIRPLSDSETAKDITYTKVDPGFDVLWGSQKFKISSALYQKILKKYFTDCDQWYPLGASEDKPMIGGLGEFVEANSVLSPRHASAIAAIMVHEGDLTFKGKKPILLMRVKK